MLADIDQNDFGFIGLHWIPFMSSMSYTHENVLFADKWEAMQTFFTLLILSAEKNVNVNFVFIDYEFSSGGQEFCLVSKRM